MILDYSKHISQRESYGLNSGPRKAEDESLFFHKREYCVLCKKITKQVYNNTRIDTKAIPGVAWHKINSVFTCGCGWWEHTFYGYLEGENHGFKDWAFEIDSAILRKYNIDSNEVPINVLSQHLVKRYDDIYHINHKKMEELVASVLSEHFTCKAHIVGKTNDGGVDLILIEANEPIIVQVKRRTKGGKVESVSQIRELIGTTLLKDSSRCIFVTTADHFSRQAIKTKNQALKKKLVTRFDFIDYHKFSEILKLYKKADEDHWQGLIER